MDSARRLHVGQLNDSFPPTIDGVAQAVKNYAQVMQDKYCDVTVVTPRYKDVDDDYPFEVIRYPSISLDKRIGYRAGNPFAIETVVKLRQKQFDLLHVHSPFASSVLAENVARRKDLPVVLTYHTKFEIDIAKRIKTAGMRRVVMRFVLDNVNKADEVWVVTEGCGKALRSIGYRGNYMVMENGTDFAYGRASDEAVAQLRARYHLADDAFVFLFVGRMMWYKNIRLILDTLTRVKAKQLPFHAFLIGDGFDAGAIQQYADEHGLSQQVTFTGPLYDREALRIYYSLADVFLFPSTYDTSGIVVKEAAACDCPSMLIRHSCASEGVEHGISGFLAEENADDCARVLLDACQSRDTLKKVSRNAGERLYLSWETAAGRAYRRYAEILNTEPSRLPFNSRHL